jgi:hypothetical protein
MLLLVALLLLGLYSRGSVARGDRVTRQECDSSSTATPSATVKNGTYTGVYSAGYQQDFFLGMPYAQVC